MSTTLLPPGYYVAKPRGQIARYYETTAQAANAIAARLPSTPIGVSVVTGKRRRSLTDSELRDIARHVRAQRRYTDKRHQAPREQIGTTTPPASAER